MFLGLNKLQKLWIGYNKISLVATNNYTNTTLPELYELELSSCNLKEFPPFLRFQNKLIYLVLYDKKIDGLVPTWIWNNTRETLVAINGGATLGPQGAQAHPQIINFFFCFCFFTSPNSQAHSRRFH